MIRREHLDPQRDPTLANRQAVLHSVKILDARRDRRSMGRAVE